MGRRNKHQEFKRRKNHRAQLMHQRHRAESEYGTARKLASQTEQERREKAARSMAGEVARIKETLSGGPPVADDDAQRLEAYRARLAIFRGEYHGGGVADDE